MKIEKITPQIAALYIGQKCENVNSASFEIAGVSFWGVTDGDRFVAPFDGLMLHLRRLESITEDEAIHIHDDVMGFPYAGIRPCIEWICLGFPGNSSFYQDARGYPSCWLYLLSKGFDLFGLIDAGLAKDVYTMG